MGIFVRILLAISILHLGTCAYEPYEDLKNRYSDVVYDIDLADATQAEMEQNCTEIQGTNEGVCFDDCMLRGQYHIVQVLSPFLQYAVHFQNNLPHLETNILHIKREELDRAPSHSPLWGAFEEHCATDFWKALFFDRADYKKIKAQFIQIRDGQNPDGFLKLCPDFFNAKILKRAEKILNCVKEQLKKPIVP